MKTMATIFLKNILQIMIVVAEHSNKEMRGQERHEKGMTQWSGH